MAMDRVDCVDPIRINTYPDTLLPPGNLLANLAVVESRTSAEDDRPR